MIRLLLAYALIRLTRALLRVALLAAERPPGLTRGWCRTALVARRLAAIPAAAARPIVLAQHPWIATRHRR